MVPIQGTLYMSVQFGLHLTSTTQTIKFYVINTPSLCNEIIESPALSALQAITQRHKGNSNSKPEKVQSIKTPQDPNYHDSNIQVKIQQHCYHSELTKVEVVVDTELVNIQEDRRERQVKIEAGLDSVFRNELIQLLKKYVDVFAWGPEDMSGIAELVTMHSLDVRPATKPVKQK